MINFSDPTQRMQTNQENLILVDSHDLPVGKLDKYSAHRGTGKLHRAFTVFLQLKGTNCWLFTQRSQEKPLWPLFWDGACSSHPWWPDETVEHAIRRRVPFELGIPVASELKYLGTYEYHAEYNQDWSENEMNHIYTGQVELDPLPNPAEVADWKWIEAAEYTTLKLPWAPWVEEGWEKVCQQQ